MAKAPSRKAPAGCASWSPDKGRRWTLADGLGLIMLVVLTFAWTVAGDGSAITAMILLAGAVACLPFGVARRWGIQSRGALVPVGASLLLLVWGFISALGSGAPWQVSLYGWFGRSDGLLTLLAVLALLVSASTLARVEIDRVVTWLLAAGAILVVEAMAQQVGATYPPRSQYEGVAAALINPNFFAAASAMLALLAVGRALDSTREAWQRWAAVALALGLASSSALSLSVQGPVALAIGLVVGAIAWSLRHRGRGRTLALSLSAIALLAGLVGFVLIVLRVAPFAAVRQGQTIGYREAYWEAAWRMISALPLFGSGPDGFARYVSEFRSETYLEAPGSGVRVSAAHDVALQYGATFGVVGLVLWLILMASVGVLLVRTLVRDSGSVWLVASIAGAWVAYLAQSAISIDAPGLKGLGWLITGLVIAMAMGRTPLEAKPAAWLPFASAGLALAGLVIWLPPIVAVNSAFNESTVEGALDQVSSAMTPCPAREDMLVGLSQVVPLQDLSGVAQQTLDTDPRCPGLAVLVSEIQVRGGDAQGALRSAEVAVNTDPLAPGSWYVLSLALGATGDVAGAESALEEARRLAAIDPDESVDRFLTEGPAGPTTSP